jgi:hypothetical protein
MTSKKSNGNGNGKYRGSFDYAQDRLFDPPSASSGATLRMTVKKGGGQLVPLLAYVGG